MVLSNRTKNQVNICSSCSLSDSGAGGVESAAMGVVVGEGRRVVVLAACLGTVRVKPCNDPDPLVNDLHKLPHAPNCSQSNSKATHPLFLSLFSQILGAE